MTGVGRPPWTGKPNARQYRSLSDTTVTLADATDDVGVVKFTEPSGQARLDTSIAYRGAGPSTDYNAALNISLFSPSGKLAETSSPQGTGNYSDAQVPIPPLVPGRPSSSATRPPRGERSVRSNSGRARQVGSVSAACRRHCSPFHRVAPSRSPWMSPPRTSRGTSRDPSVLTDHGGPSFAAVTTIPVTLRSLVPTPNPSSTFTGVLTGGNGRQFNSGQTAYYEVSIPAGTPVLNAEITTPNAANTFRPN